MKIYVDYDTTLVNLIDPWIAWINDTYNVNIVSSDINRWYYLSEVFGKEADDYWKSEKYNHYTDKDIFKPYDGAVKFFNDLQKRFGDENIFIVSSTRDHHIEDKIKHAKYYFGISENNFIPVSKEKYHQTKDGVLIDDYPLHILEHIYHNQQVGIIFNYQNRFGWCNENNYHLDAMLSPFINILKDENFNMAASYDEVLNILKN